MAMVVVRQEIGNGKLTHLLHWGHFDGHVDMRMCIVVHIASNGGGPGLH